MTLAPPMPNLQSLKVTDIDPLCYADDISYLLLGSKNLRHLTLHWSPRMRQASEPSTHPSAYFGRCEAAKYLMPLKSIAMHNLYTYDYNSRGTVLNFDTIEEVTCLNSIRVLGNNDGSAFLDNGLRKHADYILPNLKMLRIDKVSRDQCDFLGAVQGLERLYLIGPKSKSSSLPKGNGRDTLHSAAHTPPTSDISSPNTTTSTGDPQITSSASIRSLKVDYLENIVRKHGSTLRHLLLIPQWKLTADDIAIIVRQCPNLEQLGIHTDFNNFAHLRLLVPFLPKLKVVRILGDDGEGGDGNFVEMMRDLDSRGLHAEKIGQETVNREWSKLRFIELGASDLIFEVSGRYRVEDAVDGEGKEVWRRHVKKVGLEEVGDIEIWKMDSGFV